MPHRKPTLPEKPCAACGRPFTWRRKWARCWDEVRFCSDACRTGRRDVARRRASRSKNGAWSPGASGVEARSRPRSPSS